ncbi:MAG: HlyD family secretion protein [Prevotella sp.]
MNKRTRKTVANVVIVAMIMCGAAWIASVFIHVGGEYTNNAQVEQDIVNVNARVQGFVKHIYVDEFQHVEKGDTLLTIEDSEFRLHLAQAQAAARNARAGKWASEKSVQGARNQMGVTDAGIAEVEVLLKNAEADFLRYKALYEKEAVTRQQYESVATRYESLKAKVETMRRQKAGTSIAHAETGFRMEQQSSAIEVADAALDLARLNFSYCTVTAPCSGYTARRIVQEGELAMPGMRLFTIVSDERRWVTANFRETQLGGIRIGSTVDMRVDAFSGSRIEGKVVAISTATGAQYSAVAPDNSTGNFVKVEQRIPVKIAFTGNNDPKLLRQLSAGMNVECTVKSE